MINSTVILGSTGSIGRQSAAVCERLGIRVPALGSEVYHLVYTGKSASYALSLSRRFGRLSAKFTEPNPTDRT